MAETSDRSFLQVSLISLIANPLNYDGKDVNIEGIGYFDSKNSINAIFLTRDDKLAGNSQNGLFLYLTDEVKNPDRFNNKYVVVCGQFRANVKGHLSSFNGSLVNVGRVQTVVLNVR